MEYRDYYKIMGVERSATQDEIKKAYRKLARKFHPDVSKEKDAENKFKEVQEANSVLSDPEKRAAYDQLGSNYRQGQQFKPPPDWGRNFEFSSSFGQEGQFGAGDAGGFSDFFSSMFGGGSPFGRGEQAGPYARGGGRSRVQAGRDHNASIEITLEEAFRGGSRMLQLQRPQVTDDGHVQTKTHELRVTIPTGVTHGQKIRLTGQGEAAPGGRGKPGDLYLEIQIQAHPVYELEGRDVTLKLPLAPWEAALGATVKVPTLAGAVDLRVPAGARAGQKMRLRGRGLPGATPGDQYVVFEIALPPANDDTVRALYEEMREKLAFDPRAGLAGYYS